VPWIAWPKDKTIELTDVRNNLIINSGQARHEPVSGQSAVFIDYNAYVNTPAGSDNGVSANDVRVSFNPSQFGHYCFAIQKRTKSRSYCALDVFPDSHSFVVNAGDPTVGSKGNFGIDNAVGMAKDFNGFGRDVLPDFGAFENSVRFSNSFYLPLIGR
jgi:hypothetical protein